MEKTLADELRGIDMKVIWGVVFGVVALFGGQTIVQILSEFLSNQGGLGGEGIGFLFLKAVETFALTAGVACIAYFLMTGRHRNKNSNELMLWGAGILIGTALLGALLGVGLLPDFSRASQGGGYPLFRLLSAVISAYAATHSFAQIISALLIGSALALQIERSLHSQLADKANA